MQLISIFNEKILLNYYIFADIFLHTIYRKKLDIYL